MGETELNLRIPKSRVYVFVWLALVALTATTVAVARLHLNYAVLLAIFIASTKSGLVLTFFMHLRDEPLILKVMLFIALFALTLIVLLTFSDVWFRYR
ncbi:MAG TPA: cytochrome C oxidase subunit IV family protein [Thermodesulfovibrionales bacterium]|nr:cytochrome C oxidase subunit IV family protein [Thermodesulfovibrionales bacterium]